MGEWNHGIWDSGNCTSPVFVGNTIDAREFNMRVEALLTQRTAQMSKDNENTQDKAIRSIIKQWEGGEHKLAGARASELIYGKGTKANQKIYDEILKEAPGIANYVSAPNEPPVTQVPDQGGYPLATQPENTESATGASNGSTDEAKAEQNEIDDVLKSGREAREQNGNSIGSTELNPPASNVEPDATNDKPTASKLARSNKK